MKYYHGTSSALPIGEEILPAAVTGKLTEFRLQRRHKVFLTTNKDTAKVYAKRAAKLWGGSPVVYEVRPVGAVKTISKRGYPFGPVFAADSAIKLNPPSKLRYYHGSKHPLKLGTVLAPIPDGYVQMQYKVHGDEDNWIEVALEQLRPEDKLSRLESVFLIASEGAPNPDLINLAGGYTDYIYEVVPKEPVEASDLYYYSRAIDALGRVRAKHIADYWAGTKSRSKRSLIEYRAPSAVVVAEWKQ